MFRRCFAPLVVASLAACMLIGVTGCKSSAKTSPKKPPKIVQEVNFKTLWKANTGLGLGDVQKNIAPEWVTVDGQPLLAAADYRGTVTLIDPSTGKRIWRQRLKLPISSAMGETPDALVMGSSKGDVIALSKVDGKTLWKTSVTSEVLAAPRGNQQSVAVLSLDSRLHGLDSQTGKPLWEFDASPPPLLLRGATNPLVIDGQVLLMGFASGQAGLFRLSDGQPLWVDFIARPHGRNELERMVDINGQMAHVGPMVYIVTYQGKLVAMDLATMNTVWSHDMSSYVGLVVAGDQLILADDEDNIYAVNRHTGETLWKQTALKGKYVVTPGVYDQYVVVGDAYGYVYALSRESGRLLGSHRLYQAAIRMPILTDAHGAMAQSHPGRITKFVITPKPKK